MKKVITLIVSLGVVLLVAFFSINLFTNSKLNIVKQKVIEINPEITSVETINSNGKWGEWFSEYILVVEINGLKYRIWTSDKGEITDKESL
ncbi:hypothetical protein ACIQ34_00315 [Ureibacillus sp. NPDC094379]